MKEAVHKYRGRRMEEGEERNKKREETELCLEREHTTRGDIKLKIKFVLFNALGR